MKLIVGLGNPGAKHAGNRHNIGFMAVDAIQTDHGFAPWRKRFRGRTAEGTLDGVKVLLLKPDTYMNESGRSVAEAARFLKIKPADIIVFHDELDLAPGKFRTKIGGGHAGHNGLRSITNHLGNAFARVRLGIGHPGRKDLVAGYVLKDFAKADGTWLTPLLDDIAREAGLLAKGELERFQTAVSQRLADRSGMVSPAPPSPGRSGRVDLGRPGQRGRAQGSAGRSETKSDGRPGGRPSQRELAARAASSSGRATPKRARTQPTQKREEAPEQVASPAADASPKTALGQKLTEQLGRLFSRKTDGS